MTITTENKELALALQNDSKAARKFGAFRLRIMQQRIKAMQKVENLEGLRHFPGHFHELTEDRKGQWAFDYHNLKMIAI